MEVKTFSKQKTSRCGKGGQTVFLTEFLLTQQATPVFSDFRPQTPLWIFKELFSIPSINNLLIPISNPISLTTGPT